jgi:hypothetical protein
VLHQVFELEDFAVELRIADHDREPRTHRVGAPQHALE